MSTNPLYCFEQAMSNTIARMISANSYVQVIRDGKETGRFPNHMNTQASFSKDGKAYLFSYINYRNMNYIIDLAGEFPQEPAETVKGLIIHPDGRHIINIENVNNDSNQTEPLILTSTHIESGKKQTICRIDTTCSEMIGLSGGESSDNVSRSLDEDKLIKPEIIFAGDGETWVIMGHYRLITGKGDTVQCSVHWKEFFYPLKYTLDTERERILLSGKPGISAVSFNGKVEHYWHAEIPCEPYQEYGREVTKNKVPVASPAVYWNNRLVAVLQLEANYGKPNLFQVSEFDRDTLQYTGPVEGMPLKKLSEDQCALLPLADGSLAWIPYDQPIIILPARDTERKSSDQIICIGDEPPPRIPVPDKEWYNREIGLLGTDKKLDDLSPGERKSLARFFLNELSKDNNFQKLIQLDPLAFKPFHEQIVTWELKELGLLENMAFRDYWKIMNHADDGVVDGIAGAVKVKDPLEKADNIRVHLLAGCNTGHSLEVLGELSRSCKEIKRICQDLLLFIPRAGPAEQRFLEDPYESSYGKRKQDDKCPGSEAEDFEVKFLMRLEPYRVERPYPQKRVGRIGGYPDWWQHPEVPACPDCGRMMFYIGEVFSSHMRDDMIDAAIFGFHCEKCGIGAQILQIT
ncbi:MAG: hypothetical protein JXB88_07530 [Spirochaetales bacterium]|nr:hypothetical protein [Spirochaetales bacterium]